MFLSKPPSRSRMFFYFIFFRMGQYVMQPVRVFGNPHFTFHIIIIGDTRVPVCAIWTLSLSQQLFEEYGTIYIIEKVSDSCTVLYEMIVPFYTCNNGNSLTWFINKRNVRTHTSWVANTQHDDDVNVIVWVKQKVLTHYALIRTNLLEKSEIRSLLSVCILKFYL